MVYTICIQVELIKDKGYPAETHYVTTSDGYVLALHRIPRLSGKDTSKGSYIIINTGNDLIS